MPKTPELFDNVLEAVNDLLDKVSAEKLARAELSHAVSEVKLAESARDVAQANADEADADKDDAVDALELAIAALEADDAPAPVDPVE